MTTFTAEEIMLMIVLASMAEPKDIISGNDRAELIRVIHKARGAIKRDGTKFYVESITIEGDKK